MPRDRLSVGPLGAAVLSLTMGCGSPTTDESEPDGFVLMEDRFFHVAHRGGARLWPEHTLLAYDSALAAGADVLECDVHASADGHLVCIHDATLERTTNGTGRVRDHGLAALQQLDAAYRFGEEDGYPHRGDGLTIPTLDTVLTRWPDVPISLEIKQVEPSIVEPLVDLLDAHDAWNRAVIMSFFEVPIVALRDLAPEALTALTLAETERLLAGSETQPTGHIHIPPDFGGHPLTAAEVAHARARGVRVWVWTLNDPTTMRTMLDLGVDGIFTDDPVLLEQVLSEPQG